MLNDRFEKHVMKTRRGFV